MSDLLNTIDKADGADGADVAEEVENKKNISKANTVDNTASNLNPKSSKTVISLTNPKPTSHAKIRNKPSFLTIRSSSSTIMSAIQLAMNYCLSKLSNISARDMLMDDFFTINIYLFPSAGSNADQTPAHPYPDFSFQEYSPVAFRYFRDIFGIKPEDYLNSMCGNYFKELSNSGSSGSLFYITSDDLFVIKTVDQREAKFLQQLLPGYYMNLHQNCNTLLPKFFGLYYYRSIANNFRVVIMNNLLPSELEFSEKYDIKGSSYKRRASAIELGKKYPTLKDLDFIERHPKCLTLDEEYYELIISTIERDARVLESFKIMDYSLLIGIHRISKNVEEKTKLSKNEIKKENIGADGKILQQEEILKTEFEESTHHDTLSKEMRGLMIQTDNISLETYLHGGIPAKDSEGNKLLLYIGIIDILQNYRLAKKIEHKFKSFLHDGNTISVNKPSFYKDRFLNFCKNRVFTFPGIELKQISKSQTYLTAQNSHKHRMFSIYETYSKHISAHTQRNTNVNKSDLDISSRYTQKAENFELKINSNQEYDSTITNL